MSEKRDISQHSLTGVAIDINVPEIRQAVGILRYRIFAEFLKWVTGDPESRTEFDEYDEEAVHLAVFCRDKPQDILSYTRILNKRASQRGLMIENATFRVLLGEGLSVPPSSIEVSRFCLEPGIQGTPLASEASLLLFQTIYQYMKQGNFTHLFAIADGRDERGYSHKDYLLKRFSFRVIGVPHQYKKNVDTHGLVIEVDKISGDLEKLEKG